jgi:hypothetical protein
MTDEQNDDVELILAPVTEAAEPINPLLRLKQPTKGLQVQFLWQYRAVSCHIHRLQVVRGANNDAWEHI